MRYKKDQTILKNIENCYDSKVYGGSIFLPIGSSESQGADRYKSNNLEQDIKNMQVNYLYGGGYYTLKHIKHNENEICNSESGATFSDIYILVESIENLEKMQKIKVVNDMT